MLLSSTMAMLFFMLCKVLICGILYGEIATPQLNPWPFQRSNVQDILFFKEATGKKVVTLFGYASAGYEKIDVVMKAIEIILDERFLYTEWIINAPGSAPGIGNFYARAFKKNYETMGIISSHVIEVKDKNNPNFLRYMGYPVECKNIFMIQDVVWGGYISNDVLSPTTAAMVEVSDAVIQVGGNEVARDELIASLNVPTIQCVIFIPAKMDPLYDDTSTHGFGEASLEVTRILAHGGHTKLEIDMRFVDDLGGLPETKD